MARITGETMFECESCGKMVPLNTMALRALRPKVNKYDESSTWGCRVPCCPEAEAYDMIEYHINHQSEVSQEDELEKLPRLLRPIGWVLGKLLDLADHIINLKK